MKLTAIAAITLVTLSLAAYAQEEAKPEPRPPGVEEANWVQVSETFGFVITKDVETSEFVEQKTGKRHTYLPKGKQLSGYFVVRRAQGWCRVNVEPGDAMISPLTRR